MGACLAFRGIAGSMVLLHGSQGCSTYMRRYISSHFNEPVDIASSALSEKSAVFGGAANLTEGISNVIARYSPSLLGVATTCLTETIGDDVGMIVGEWQARGRSMNDMPVIPVSTPSYSGSHVDGFSDACVAVLERLAEGGAGTDAVNLFPGFLSPADIRHLKAIVEDFSPRVMVLPDISETLDGGVGESYRRIPEGGTAIGEIRAAGAARASIEFSVTAPGSQSAAFFLEERFGVPASRLPVPIGVRYTDRLLDALSEATGRPVPARLKREREMLLDAMVDAHKYLFGRRAAVYGDPEFVIGVTSFLVDTGIMPAVVASGAGNERFVEEIGQCCSGLERMPAIMPETDFGEIAGRIREGGADILVGSSKGSHIARELGIPLVRVGFPIHDRMGAQRILHVGYRGALNLLDLLTNTVIATQQERLGHGYSYM